MTPKPAIVIVEGPDGAGKSMLVDYLADQLSGAKWHCGVPTDHPLIEYLDVVMKAVVDQKLLIVDRLHLGEQVYGPIMRDEDSLGLRGRYVFERVLRSFFRPVVVICQPPFRTCLDNWAENHANEYVKDVQRYRDVWTAFTQVATTLPVIKYDYTADDRRETLRRIRDELL